MILFLGAGASRTFSIPTTKEFIEVFEQEIGSSDLYKEIKGGIGEEVLDLESLMTILDDLSRPKDELLEVISPFTARFILEGQAELGISYCEKTGLQDEAKRILNIIRKTIRKECILATADQKRRDLIANTYNALFYQVREIVDSVAQKGKGKLVYPQPLSVFTTNYDTCIETYFSNMGVDFERGIEHGKLGYNILNCKMYYRNKDNVEIFKLHGSIDLYKSGEYIRHFTTFDESYEPQKTYLGDEIGEEFLVYPIESSGARHIYQNPYLDMYSLFRTKLVDELNLSRRLWLIIGSSFRDITITSILNDVLMLYEPDQRLKVVLVDPIATQIKSRLYEYGFKTLATRIVPIDSKFEAGESLKKLSDPQTYDQH